MRGYWDRLRVSQVVTNLLSNAVKYGAGKPVEVELGRAADRAPSSSVRDHGIGIDPADQPQIFERFERAVSSRNYGGLGLGLYIVKRIVEAHGGTIRVDSTPGEGARSRRAAAAPGLAVAGARQRGDSARARTAPRTDASEKSRGEEVARAPGPPRKRGTAHVLDRLRLDEQHEHPIEPDRDPARLRHRPPPRGTARRAGRQAARAGARSCSSTSRARCSAGSVSSVKPFASSSPPAYSSNRSAQRGSSRLHARERGHRRGPVDEVGRALQADAGLDRVEHHPEEHVVERLARRPRDRAPRRARGLGEPRRVAVAGGEVDPGVAPERVRDGEPLERRGEVEGAPAAAPRAGPSGESARAHASTSRSRSSITPR